MNYFAVENDLDILEEDGFGPLDHRSERAVALAFERFRGGQALDECELSLCIPSLRHKVKWFILGGRSILFIIDDQIDAEDKRVLGACLVATWKLKEYRGIAMRSCKTDQSFAAFISLAATIIQLR
ncbi:hypothetical protein [Celeribacter baekdonensis]|uniref:hypothetical protein n=1 Tax=Celeribacter baekdonensis TaxID=875171 RepID=UPI000942B754|nr:hypothetical protein [Celeribacter baekdonensis]